MLHKHKNNIEYKKNWENIFKEEQPTFGDQQEKKEKLYVGLRRMGLATKYTYSSK